MRSWVILLFLFIFPIIVGAQIDTTATPQPMHSIFDYDICEPPCWLDLIPGESTPADVDQTLKEHSDLIDPHSIKVGPTLLTTGYDINPDTGYMNNGSYSFDIAGQVIEQGPIRFRNRIDVREGVVELIVILDYKPIPLAQVLESLGKPDVIRLLVDTADETRLRLIYLEAHLWVNLTQTTNACLISTLSAHMMVDSVLYYSPDAAIRRIDTEYKVLQPALTGYRLLNDRDVPSEKWETWLEGDVDISCKDAWEQLPEPEITPAVEVTTESQS